MLDLVVDVARCFASMAIYDAQEDRDPTNSTMLPGQPGSGVRNNAYTNILFAWILRRTATLVNQLNRDDAGTTYRRLSIRADELDRWGPAVQTASSPLPCGRGDQPVRWL